MDLNYEQNKKVERVIAKYSLALGYDPAKKFVDSIVGSALSFAEKDHIPADNILGVIIKELYHHYRESVAPIKKDDKRSMEVEAEKVLVTLQDLINVAFGKASQL